MKVPRNAVTRALSWCEQLEAELQRGEDKEHTLEVVREMFQEWVNKLNPTTAQIAMDAIRAYTAEILANECEV